MEPGAFEALVSSMYRSRRLRKTIWEMPRASSYRRSSILRFFAWCYRRFSDGRGIPYAVFAPEFELHQTAAMIDTAGTFTGPSGMDLVYEELAAAFGEFSFQPVNAIELEGDRLLLIVSFQATGRGSGLELDRKVGHLFEVTDGCALRLDVFWEEADALEAAGIAPSAA